MHELGSSADLDSAQNQYCRKNLQRGVVASLRTNQKAIQNVSGICYSLLCFVLSKFLDGFPQLVQLGTQLFVFSAKFVNLITNFRSMGLH